jgi:hypothetical protein
VSRRLAWEILGVLGGALLVVALLLGWDGPERNLRGDQQVGNLIALKYLHPDALPGDAFYGPAYYRGFNPAFFSLQAWVARVTGEDVEEALRLLTWPIGLLYVIGHYTLFRYLTGGWQAAALGALSAMVVRSSLGGEYWGFGGLRDALPRVIVSGLTPLLLLAFLRLRGRPLFAGYFFLVGLAANLHPVSGLHLAQITAVAHLWLSRFQLPAWRDVLVGIPIFAAGALPFILRYVPAQEHLTDPALLPTVREAQHYRYPYLLLPLEPSALTSLSRGAPGGRAAVGGSPGRDARALSGARGLRGGRAGGGRGRNHGHPRDRRAVGHAVRGHPPAPRHPLHVSGAACRLPARLRRLAARAELSRVVPARRSADPVRHPARKRDPRCLRGAARGGQARVRHSRERSELHVSRTGRGRTLLGGRATPLEVRSAAHRAGRARLHRFLRFPLRDAPADHRLLQGRDRRRREPAILPMVRLHARDRGLPASSLGKPAGSPSLRSTTAATRSWIRSWIAPPPRTVARRGSGRSRAGVSGGAARAGDGVETRW